MRNEKNGAIHCLVCDRRRQITQKQKWIESGLCERCGNTKSKSHVKCCNKCYLKGTASKTLKDRTRWREIGLKLIEQNCRCVYSGRLLVLGVNTSLDHIVPRCKGGTHDANNLQWIDYAINIMKSGLTEDEFLGFIRDIAKHNQF